MGTLASEEVGCEWQRVQHGHRVWVGSSQADDKGHAAPPQPGHQLAGPHTWRGAWHRDSGPAPGAAITKATGWEASNHRFTLSLLWRPQSEFQVSGAPSKALGEGPGLSQLRRGFLAPLAHGCAPRLCRGPHAAVCPCVPVSLCLTALSFLLPSEHRLSGLGPTCSGLTTSAHTRLHVRTRLHTGRLGAQWPVQVVLRVERSRPPL